jgi:putative spermidine/putrescine transport system ATP-binding protein
VIAAVRPEDIDVTTAESGDNRIKAAVEVVEYQGREMAVEARTAEGRALHLRTSQRLAPGDDVVLTVPQERLLVFPLGLDEHSPEPLVEAGVT